MTGRPNLNQSVRNQVAERQAAADERGRPEREARDARMARDAALYGTAGWASLSPARQHMVSLWVQQNAGQGGGNDAA